MERNRAHAYAAPMELPIVARSKEGYEFYPRESTWKIVDQTAVVHFHFDELTECCAENILNSFQLTLLHYIENMALSHASNMHKYFLHFCRALYVPGNKRLCNISDTMLINYKAKLEQNEWYLGSISGFFKKWEKLGYSGIDEEVIRLLNGMRIKGNPKGDAVRTMDPVKGPFTENELLSIHEALCNRYKSGAIGNREFALVWLFMALGLRPVQYAMLKIKDFAVFNANDGSLRYMINMPRAKQRGVMARELLTQRLLCKEAGMAVAVWIEQLKAESENSADPGDLPIFPRWGHESPIGLHHMTSNMLAVELRDVIYRLNVISERTGERIEFQSKRFRYTVGTRAAEEGHGELVIAQLLDQTDTQNVRVYVESTAKVAGVIDKAMAPYMAPVAQAFKGMIIRSDDDCPDGKRIGSGNPDKSDVGKCGRHGFCDAAAPHVCYICVNFNPWLDGPHEEVLKELLEEKERVLAVTKDKRITEAKDRIIMAVSQVVEMCREMKNKEGKIE